MPETPIPSPKSANCLRRSTRRQSHPKDTAVGGGTAPAYGKVAETQSGMEPLYHRPGTSGRDSIWDGPLAPSAPGRAGDGAGLWKSGRNSIWDGATLPQAWEKWPVTQSGMGPLSPSAPSTMTTDVFISLRDNGGACGPPQTPPPGGLKAKVGCPGPATPGQEVSCAVPGLRR